MSKGSAQRSHFKKRIFERYNYKLNDEEYNYLVSRFTQNDKTAIKFLFKQSNRISIHVLLYKTLEIVTVYDKIRKTLVTCLPNECCDVTKIFSYIQEIEE